MSISAAPVNRALDVLKPKSQAVLGFLMLDFYIAQKSGAQDEGTWQHIGGMGLDEWQALSIALGCEPYCSGEDFNDWKERARPGFQRVQTEYPLLIRASDYWDDAWYNPVEVEQLRAECLRVLAQTSNKVVANVLMGLIKACDEALTRKWGLLMAAD